MARVVLAQIEFTRAILWLAQNSTYVMVIIIHDNSLLSYWNPVPIHDVIDSYQTMDTLLVMHGTFSIKQCQNVPQVILFYFTPKCFFLYCIIFIIYMEMVANHALNTRCNHICKITH